ncbi:MAG: DUF3500 domain-containing protein [Candidatus Entotheonellia bacterium]
MSLPSESYQARPYGQPLSRRQLMRQMITAAMWAALPPPIVAPVQIPAQPTITQAPSAFLQALATEKHRRAMFPFDSPERFNWHYIPRRRMGLPIKDMIAEERTAAHQLLRSALSEAGYRKAVAIMRLEEVLRQMELFGFSRDMENYAFTVFSTVDAPFPLGWRVEGHHLSLNVTLVNEAQSAVTPAFLGAHPAEVRDGPLKGLRALAQEQDLAFDLMRRLDPNQRRKALFASRSLGDIVSGPGRSNDLQLSVGLALAEMTPAQRDAAIRLVEEYVRNVRDDIAAAQLRRVHEAGIDKLQFAWAGSLEPDQAHYYRLHGPTLLIEYDNTRNDANHIHSVWHDLRHDFGGDLLRAHYETGHQHRP